MNEVAKLSSVAKAIGPVVHFAWHCFVVLGLWCHSGKHLLLLFAIFFICQQLCVVREKPKNGFRKLKGRLMRVLRASVYDYLLDLGAIQLELSLPNQGVPHVNQVL